MNKNVVIGIDVGGSTTKIVGFEKTNNEYILIDPLFVRATDPLTSTYGAFGKFTDQNNLSLSDIRKVMITGAGSSHLAKPLYSLDCEKIPEFRCIGLGGLYLCSHDKAIIVSMGTGTAVVYAVKGHEPCHIGGTGVGGGTLLGLSKLILGMDNVAHISEIAKNGDLSRIDLRISDIMKNSFVPGYPENMTASNFGNISDIADKADIALGIINMVFETIGTVSRFAARNYGLKDIVLTGNLIDVAQSTEIFKGMSIMFDVNYIIPKYAQFGTVIGAALAGCEDADIKQII